MTIKKKINSFLQRIDLDLRIIFLAVRDPLAPKWIKFIAGFFIALALSPIDLIPDFIPLLGFVDDIIIIPLGIIIVKKLLPDHLLSKYKEEALDLRLQKKKRGLYIVLTIWFLLLLIITFTIFFKSSSLQMEFIRNSH